MVVRINESGRYDLVSAIYYPAFTWVEALPDLMDCVSVNQNIMLFKNDDLIVIMG